MAGPDKGSDHGDPAVSERVVRVRKAFDTGLTKPYAWRMEQLRSARRMLIEEQEQFATALADDLGKGATEAWLTETGFLVAEIDHLLRHLRGWLRPRRVGTPLWLAPARASVVREPLGVVLVIAPWNYPVQLSLAPLVGAIGGGNAVVLKPSEHAPATSALLARLLPRYLDPDAVAVVEGDIPVTTALLQERFDHIFYTGNGTVGRIILAAAAKNLTPVTLELGGKSPTYVDESADLQVAARRIVWGKFTNAGQTCIAPDYVLATRPVLERLKPLLAAAIREFHSEDPSGVPHYGRIVHHGHFRRLEALLGRGTVVIGGRTEADGRYMEPTVIDGVRADDPVMQEEIFGPILPLLEVAGVDEAIEFITVRDKPLVIYLFTERAETRRRFLRDTSSGALAVNVPLAHMVVSGLPFGGVGESGMGAYHGQSSIDVFTHAKPVLRKPTSPDTLTFVYPPYTSLKEKVIRRIIMPARRR